MSFYFFYDKYIVSLKFSFKGVTLHSYSQYRKSILLLHPKNISWLKKELIFFIHLNFLAVPYFYMTYDICTTGSAIKKKQKHEIYYRFIFPVVIATYCCHLHS